MSRATFQEKPRQIKLNKGTIFPVSLEPHANKIGTKKEVPDTLNIQE